MTCSFTTVNDWWVSSSTLRHTAGTYPQHPRGSFLSLSHITEMVLAANVPNPAPVDPTGGSNGIQLLLSYAKWGVLLACGIVAVVSGGLIAFGTISDRPGAGEKGKRAFVFSLIGVVASAIAIPMVNTVFGATS